MSIFQRQMQAFNDYIIQIEKDFNDTIKVGEVDLYLDKKMSSLRAANRVGKVVKLPINKEDAVAVGDEVVFDPTILFAGVIHETEQDSPYLIDKDKGWYRLPFDLLVLFRKKATDQWQTTEDLILLKPLDEQKKLTSSFLEIVSLKNEKTPNMAEVVFSNPSFEEQGVQIGDKIALAPNLHISYWLDEEEYWCVHKRNILALVA